jgi:recombination associated protein RdgC
MISLQIEEKILPATVIRQELNEKIKQIKTTEHRKVGQKEKLTLKDEVTLTLLTRAFSKLTKIYAYIDTKNQWLVLGTTNAKKTEQFMSMFKKSVTEKAYPIALKKLSPIMTNWLKSKDYPSSFSIEKSCVLQDHRQQQRIIRCQQQDLFAESIQELIKDGCEVKQFALGWEDRLRFTLTNNFLLQGIKFGDEITAQAKEVGAETAQHKFQVDFLIMAETLSAFFKDLLQEFAENAEKATNTADAQALIAA